MNRSGSRPHDLRQPVSAGGSKGTPPGETAPHHRRGGVRRNAAVAIVRDGRIEIASEQERFIRTRGSRFSIRRTGDVVRQLLHCAGLEGERMAAFASAEEGVRLRSIGSARRAPACVCARLLGIPASPFDRAAGPCLRLLRLSLKCPSGVVWAAKSRRLNFRGREAVSPGCSASPRPRSGFSRTETNIASRRWQRSR